MKILQVHNKYKQRGGEDVVCNQEYELLTGKDISVEQYIVDNRERINGLVSKLNLVFNTHYSEKSKRTIRNLISDKEIDLMHVHNFFPLLSPSIFDACSEMGIPSVLTLHNYRLLHPNGQLMHDGEIDERSLEGSAYQCVTDGVYRDSVLQTLVVAHMIEYHRKHNTWQTKVDRFLALTEFAKSKFVQGGLPEDKIIVKPNFIEDPVQDEDNLFEKKDYYVFIGRVSQEKGMETLINAWMRKGNDSKLLIFGEGPLYEPLRNKTKDQEHIVWKGYTDRSKIFEYLRNAKALIFPSIWYEGFPMTIVEALAFGVPVITSNIGSQQEIVEDQETGLHFEVSNPEALHEKVHELNEKPEKVRYFSQNARDKYLNNYTPELNFKQLQKIYSELID